MALASSVAALSIRLGLDEPLLRMALRGFLLRVGMPHGCQHVLIGAQLRGFLRGLGGLDVADEHRLGLHFRGRDGHLLLTVRRGKRLRVLDLLLLDYHGLLHFEPLAHDVLDKLLLGLDGLLLGDGRQRDDPLTLDLLQRAILFHALFLHAIGALLVALRDDDLAVFVLLGDLQLFVHGDARLLGAQPLLRLHFLRLPPPRAR